MLAVRWIATLVLLLGVAWWLDMPRLLSEFGRFPAWVLVPAVALSVVQVCVSAWRWRYTARCLDLGLPYAVAVREYYLATFLNQVLPGGVMGDVNRAWRHSLDTTSRLASVHAVVIERLSGQLVLVALATVLCMINQLPALPVLGVGLVAVMAVMVVVLGTQRFRYGRRLARDLRAGLLRWPVGLIQLLSSALVVGSYLAVFVVLAFGAGYLEDGQSMLVLLALCSGLLLSMVIPVTVAGWGVRESAAAFLWPLAGLPAEQGVALSVGYGLLVLLASLPGALFTFSSVAVAR
ncbi:lysylphosphatidylglycerol synthase transmembrane domain-containing protein [Marinobacter sp.]|uniref:lysylphosphatidylglycerol synthase transmembrane domain-containing protein n=1 Tax=Marinobacter sp. TaxID=50741 RepID=UPI0034A21B3C